MPKPFAHEGQVIVRQVVNVQHHARAQPFAQLHRIGAAPWQQFRHLGPCGKFRQQGQFCRRRLPLPARDIDPRQGRLGPDRIAPEIADLIKRPLRGVPLGKGVVVVAYLEIGIGGGRFYRIDRMIRTGKLAKGINLALRAAWGLHRRRICPRPADRQRTDHVKGLRQRQHLAQPHLIADARIPDRLKSPQMGRDHHVIGCTRNRLHDREIAMRPAFLKTQIDQGRTIREMGIATRNILRLTFGRRVGHNDEMPVLLIARRRRLGPVPDDICQRLVINH